MLNQDLDSIPVAGTSFRYSRRVITSFGGNLQEQSPDCNSHIRCHILRESSSRHKRRSALVIQLTAREFWPRTTWQTRMTTTRATSRAKSAPARARAQCRTEGAGEDSGLGLLSDIYHRTAIYRYYTCCLLALIHTTHTSALLVIHRIIHI